MGPVVTRQNSTISANLERYADQCRHAGSQGMGEHNILLGHYVKDLVGFLVDYAFHDLILSDADFSHVDFRGCDFSRTRLTRAVFDWANLKMAKFTDARLEGVRWQFADLTGADMIGAWMEGGRVEEFFAGSWGMGSEWHLYRTHMGDWYCRWPGECYNRPASPDEVRTLTDSAQPKQAAVEIVDMGSAEDQWVHL